MSASPLQPDDFQFRLDWTAKLPAKVQESIADGMRRVDEHANPRWRHVFDACVLAAARKKPEITSDDVLCELEEVRRAALLRLLGDSPSRQRESLSTATLEQLERACVERGIRPPDDIPPSTHNLAAIGPAMQRAANMGVLAKTDRTVRSRREGKNGNLHKVWISNYYGKS